jgi:tol-pal system protein YbgF
MMTASRLRAAAGIGLATTLGLLAVSFGGCSLHREFVRRGVVLDSLASRADRIETNEETQAAFLRDLRAQTLTELEATRASIEQLEARIIDLDERLARVGRKLGVWYEATVSPDTVNPDTGATRPETTSALVRPPDTTRAAVDPDQLYNTAYLDFTRGKYQIAIAGFDQFIQMFPNSDMADNAQYWKAECYYSLNELARSEEEFRLVLTKYQTGNKLPAAAYKLGLVYLAENRKPDARRQFQDVVAKYPGTTEAKLAQDRLNSQE